MLIVPSGPFTSVPLLTTRKEAPLASPDFVSWIVPWLVKPFATVRVLLLLVADCTRTSEPAAVVKLPLMLDALANGGTPAANVPALTNGVLMVLLMTESVFPAAFVSVPDPLTVEDVRLSAIVSVVMSVAKLAVLLLSVSALKLKGLSKAAELTSERLIAPPPSSVAPAACVKLPFVIVQVL